MANELLFSEVVQSGSEISSRKQRKRWQRRCIKCGKPTRKSDKYIFGNLQKRLTAAETSTAGILDAEILLSETKDFQNVLVTTASAQETVCRATEHERRVALQTGT